MCLSSVKIGKLIGFKVEYFVASSFGFLIQSDLATFDAAHPKFMK